MVVETGIESFVKPEILALNGYVASKSPEVLKDEIAMSAEDIIKLDGNENLYGCSPRVQKALAGYQYFNIYPDSHQGELRRMLAEYAGVDAGSVVAGNGSDQLIDHVLQIFVRPGDEVINCVPTFDVFRFKTHVYGGTVVEVPRDEEFAVDVGAVKAAITDRTKIIVLATPNNPTGTITPQEDILKIAEMGLPFLVDEAYVEFSGETMTQFVSQYQNMMVLRTFSKWAGLAGMRIGFGVFAPCIAHYLMTMKLPYNVSAAAIVAVRESLKDLDYLRGNVNRLIAERERLFAELENMDFLRPVPSRANYIYCHVVRGDAAEIQRKMEKRGILIRHFDIPLLRNAIRIGVGKPEHTDAIIKALRVIGEDIRGR